MCQNVTFDTVLYTRKKYMTKYVTSFVKNKGNYFSKQKMTFLCNCEVCGFGTS